VKRKRGKRIEDDRRTSTEVTPGIQRLEISSTSAAIHRHGYLDARDKMKVVSLTRRSHELPLYEYRCLKCKRHTEKIENLNGPYLKKCPHCGGKMESVLTAPAIQFKGSGWYVNDYGRKTSGGDASKSESSEKSEKTEKSDKSEKAEKSSKSDSKSEPAKETKKTSSSKEK
jgi:putative FmdB family regulatory protein